MIVEKDWSIEYIKELAEKNKPRYIFFPFYSKKIPPELYENYECVVFHMTDLPYGRGGTPLQNLILRGYDETSITAIKVDNGIDTGGILMQVSGLCLNGTAEEIYMRAEKTIRHMIDEIIKINPVPIPQQGEVIEFKRRTPEQSNIEGIGNLDDCYDYIRMLDATGYPHAFLETDKLRFEFTRASLKKGHIIADVKITCRSGSR